MFVAWHLKGGAGTLKDWQKLTGFERSVILNEVSRRIEMYNREFDRD